MREMKECFQKFRISKSISFPIPYPGFTPLGLLIASRGHVLVTKLPSSPIGGQSTLFKEGFACTS